MLGNSLELLDEKPAIWQLLLAATPPCGLAVPPFTSLNAQSLSTTPTVLDTNAQRISVIVTGHNAGLLPDLKTEDFRLTRGAKPLALAAAQFHDEPAALQISESRRTLPVAGRRTSSLHP